jgi:hypothetical protein
MNNDLDWWTACHAMFLAVTSTMSAKQQQQILENLHGLAKLRDAKGDVIAGNFLHTLAQDECVEERPSAPSSKPYLRVVN